MTEGIKEKAVGGREFGASTKDGILREKIEPTMQYFAKLAGMPREDLILLGSAGKKAKSGDLDVAIDSRRYDSAQFEAVVRRIDAGLGAGHHVYRAGFHTHSFEVPISGNKREGWVQLDLKYNDGEFLAFSHYSAEGERSRYKGAVRAFILGSLATALHEPGKDVVHREDGRIVVDVRWGLDVNEGLKRIFRMRPMRMDGKGRKAALENVSPAAIQKEFPDLTFDGRLITIKDPDKVAAKLFGVAVKAHELDSAENVIALIKKHRPEVFTEKFVGRVAKGLRDMGSEVPHELLLESRPGKPEEETDPWGGAKLPGRR